MTTTVDLVLNNYNVSVTTNSDEALASVSNLTSQILELTNPRDILSAIESISGVESTLIKNPQTNEVLLSSGLLTPEE